MNARKIMLEDALDDCEMLSLGEDQGALSFLLRVWLEPRSRRGSSAARGYLKNLRTGEEGYFIDAKRLGEAILRQVEDGRGGERRGWRSVKSSPRQA